MRTIFTLRISKKFILSNLLNASLVFGMIGLGLLQEKQTGAESMGDMGAFIEEQLELVPAPEEMGDLGAFIESLPKDSVPVITIPVPGAPMRDAKLSDGKFEALSAKWKRGVVQVVREDRCAKHAKAFQVSAKLDPVLQKAQAIVESNCDATAVGAAGEVGIYQVMPSTCTEIGVRGDYRDPLVNATCAEKYRQVLCATSKKKCTARLMFLAHNRGVAGALRTANAEASEYVRKVDCAARVLRKQKCA
jgi:hypothetical protein